MRLLGLVMGVGIGLGVVATAWAAPANDEARWVLEERSEDGGVPVALFVDDTSRSGRPAFKIETAFPVSPLFAAGTVMQGMLNPDQPDESGERKVLERSERQAVVYSFVDLPFMLADREIALRVVYSDDADSGVHRVDWVEANDVLPESDGRIVRLTGVRGYWEFRPDGEGRTSATYVSQTEVGGSIPDTIAHRLMKSQTLDAAERLRRRIRERQRSHVAGGPPIPAPGRGGSEATVSGQP